MVAGRPPKWVARPWGWPRPPPKAHRGWPMPPPIALGVVGQPLCRVLGFVFLVKYLTLVVSKLYFSPPEFSFFFIGGTCVMGKDRNGTSVHFFRPKLTD
jgi:hypothetical protein